MLALAAVPARSHALAAVAVCGYLGTFALPFNANVPVLILALFSTLSGRLGGRAERGAPLQWAVAFFWRRRRSRRLAPLIRHEAFA